ncbi:unnamed protein product [Peniophora sp. CBMAI 1063]|nr:unnamed protein product [Peniophora sp. CBMAI 1063]
MWTVATSAIYLITDQHHPRPQEQRGYLMPLYRRIGLPRWLSLRKVPTLAIGGVLQLLLRFFLTSLEVLRIPTDESALWIGYLRDIESLAIGAFDDATSGFGNRKRQADKTSQFMGLPAATRHASRRRSKRTFLFVLQNVDAAPPHADAPRLAGPCSLGQVILPNIFPCSDFLTHKPGQTFGRSPDLGPGPIYSIRSGQCSPEEVHSQVLDLRRSGAAIRTVVPMRPIRSFSFGRFLLQ